MIRFKFFLAALDVANWLGKSMGRAPLSAFATCDSTDTSSITNFFTNLSTDLVVFALAMAAFFFALAALFYMASGATGNERTRTHAVNSLYAALAGLGLALLAGSVAGIVSNAASGSSTCS